MQSSLFKIVLQVSLILVIFASVFVANPQAMADLASYSFDDGTYSHAYLIPVIIVYLLFHATQYGEINYRWQPLFVLPLLVCLMLFVVFQLAQIPLVSRFLIPLVILFSVLSLFRISLGLIVSVSLVWFITPVWGPLQPILQEFSVQAVTQIMTWTHIPAYVEGNTVYIAVGAFEIAGGCSGLRYFITSMALSLIYSYLNFTRFKSIAIFFAIAIVGALITNWIRIFVIILIGHYTDMQSSMVEDHNTLGWYLFIPFILLLFYVGGKLETPKPLEQKDYTTPSKAELLKPATIVILIFAVSMLSVSALTNKKPIWAFNMIDIEAAPMSENLRAPSPIVPKYTAVETLPSPTNLSGAFIYEFSFNAESGAHRADYFFNQLVPENAKELSHDRGNQYGIIEVVNPNRKKAIIQYYYAVNGVHAARSGQLKILRLKAAIKLDSESKLFWHWIPCEGSCDSVRAKLKTL